MKAMILAAGRGKRMQPLTDTCPKPLLNVGGQCLIEYQIRALVHAKFKDIVINVAYLSEQFFERLGDGSRYGARIHYSLEPPAAYETGGGIVNALPLLGDQPFLVVSGDIWTDFPYASLRALTLSPEERPAHLILVDNPVHHPEGDFYLSSPEKSTTIQYISLQPVSTLPRLTFANIGVYHPQLFAGRKTACFGLGNLLRDASTRHQVTGEYFKGQWINATSPQHLDSIAAATHPC